MNLHYAQVTMLVVWQSYETVRLVSELRTVKAKTHRMPHSQPSRTAHRGVRHFGWILRTPRIWRLMPPATEEILQKMLCHPNLPCAAYSHISRGPSDRLRSVHHKCAPVADLSNAHILKVYLKNLMGLRMNGAKGTVMSAYRSNQNHCMFSRTLIMTMKNTRMTIRDPQNHFDLKCFLSCTNLVVSPGASGAPASSPGAIIEVCAAHSPAKTQFGNAYTTNSPFFVQSMDKISFRSGLSVPFNLQADVFACCAC